MANVAPDIEEYDALIEKFTGAKGAIIRRAKSQCEYFSKNPFLERTKEIWIKEVAKHLTLINHDYKEPTGIYT